MLGTPSPEDTDRQVSELDAAFVPWIWWAYGSVINDLGRLPEGDNINDPVADMLVRPHPIAVAGTPTSLTYDSATRTMTLVYDTTGPEGARLEAGIPTVLSVPTRVYTDGYQVDVAGGNATIALDINQQMLLVNSSEVGATVSVCISPTGAGCSQGCTTDVCDPATGCQHVPVAGVCDDGDACTTDTCEAGACKGALAGLANVRCRLNQLPTACADPVPAKFGRRLDRQAKAANKALTAAEKAAERGKTSRVATLKTRAGKLLAAIPRWTEKAVAAKQMSKQITSACRATLDGMVSELRDGVTALAF